MKERGISRDSMTSTSSEQYGIVGERPMRMEGKVSKMIVLFALYTRGETVYVPV
jgi:hypothetical protein